MRSSPEGTASTVGLVLSGGGMRGAYEAGVLAGVVEALGEGVADLAVGVGTADQDGVGLVRQIDVIAVAPAAAQQPLVLDSTHGLADAKSSHGV